MHTHIYAKVYIYIYKYIFLHFSSTGVGTPLLTTLLHHTAHEYPPPNLLVLFFKNLIYKEL